jgi:hypothetical protein
MRGLANADDQLRAAPRPDRATLAVPGGTTRPF